MKKLVLLLLLLGGGAPLVRAQSGNRGLWCPPGATWQHIGIVADQSMPAPMLIPVRTSYVGDTVIGGQSCQRLHLTNTRTPDIGRIYTRADADRVWLYADGQFYKMHDFSAQPGDTWMYKGTRLLGFQCASMQLTVDSVGQRFIGGQMRRWFRVRYQYGTDVVRSGRLYEGVGSLTGYLTPIGSACMPSDPAGGLQAQCYGTAAQPGLIVMGTLMGCQAVPTATHEARAEAAGFAVFPTIGSGEVTVQLPARYARATLSVFSPAGQLVQQTTAAATESRLQLAQLPRGLYLLHVQQAGQPALSRRIVLH